MILTETESPDDRDENHRATADAGPEPHRMATTITSGAGLASSLPGDGQTQSPTVAGPENSQPATDVAPWGADISLRLWNAAYDRLADPAEGTAELVELYVKTLAHALDPDKAVNPSFNISAEVNDPVKRQAYMVLLVQEARNKISMSKFTNGFSDVAEFILSAKDMISMAVENVPQVALPWAGVCIGLEVSNSLYRHLSMQLIPINLYLDTIKSRKSDQV